MYITNAVTLTGGTGGIRVTEDTFIAASGTSEIKFSTWLKTKSFVLLGGKVTLGNNASNNENSALYATGDIVLFGSAYKANDTAADGAADPSETQNLFTYNHSGRNGITASPLVNTSSFPKAPDGTLLFAGYNPYIKAGSFADLGNKTLKAGKNFYANGMNLVPTGTGAWKLDIPDNDNATAVFAEAYFTTVKNCTVTGGSVAAAEKCTDQSGNSGWEFGRPTIEKAYTYSDDTIYVKFNKSIENSNNEIQAAINAGKIRFNDGGQNFKFTSVLKVGTDGKPAGSLPAGDVAEFFLRTDGSSWQRWNTDATGISSGSNQSTDRGGSSPYEPVQNKDPRHQNIKPNLWIPKGTNSNDTLFPNLYISLRDKHKNRLLHYAGAAADASGGNGKIYGKVEDRCPPVLAAVYIGQEPHTVSSQPKYDAHNFIEFRYSEPVFIDGISDNPAIAVDEKYIRATDTLGNIATDSAKNITEVKGIASFSNGKLDTGKHGGTSGSVHAVYRTSAMRVTTLPVTDKRECRVRISVAGWVDGSVTVGGTSVHNWIGYINEALAPSGSAVPVYTQPSPNPLNTANVRTREPSASDPLKEWEKLDAQFKPKIYASSAVGLSEVGSWDTSPPVFAKASDDSAKWLDLANTSKEITAYSASSQFADKIEFHFFDNTPNYASTALWWQTAGALISNPGWNVVSPPDRYDSYGGSRFTGSNRTMGGIRACTLPAPGEVKDVFIFDAEKPEFNASLQKFSGADAAYPLTLVQKAENEAIFGSLPSGFSEQDSLYLQLRISPPSAPLKFPVTEIFTVGYRGIDTALNGGHITDLAGNLMKSCADAKSIDASPPNIALTAAPVGLKQIYVLFTSQIDTRPETLAKIPGNLELIDRPAGSTIQIDSAVPARVRTDTKNGTGIIVSLTESVTYNLLTTAKLRVKKDTDNLIHIYPKIGVYPTFEGHKHVISDFAVNIIRPLFAYDERKLDDGTSGFVTAGIYGGTSQAVRLFDGSGTPGNTVLEKEDITVHLAVENVLPGDTSAPTNLELYMENNPNPASVSVNLNKATNLGSRIWLPAITGLPSGAVSGLSVLSPEENPCSSNEVIPLSPTVPNGFKYEFKLFNNPLTVPVPSKFLNYPDGSRAEFLFALKNGSNYILIDHDCDDGGSSPTPKIPLYALRLKDPNDPASIDLWSFDISAIKKQAGGVSILNNVINVETGEKCTIAVTAEKAGSLSVMVMTLDGDVVKVLYSGHAEKGEHLYRWNGTNKNGEAVARGMYFIRVLGPGIDETRKVMAIKE
ncbi:MAG: FlgD immunoglobulin-like domain containing protein [Treponema sp.]|uniref:FlgD immunoglobulin-like domain containing protein n=1 Tax=Treponema sp. TaxID=166 RepID=UPI003FA2233D